MLAASYLSITRELTSGGGVGALYERALRRLVIFNHCLNLEALGRTVFTALDEDFLQRDWS